MKYLFAALSSGTGFDSIPYGLAYVTASLKRTGRSVSAIVLSGQKNPTEYLVRTIIDENIDVLCIGDLSGNFRTVRVTLEAVRKACPRVKIVVGGGIITAEPEFVVHHLDMDVGCIGYGEETICELADCFENKTDLSEVKGLIYKNKDGDVVKTARRPEVENLDDIPFPALDMFGFGNGINLELPIIGSRSCTHNCTFCFHPSGYKYRERSLYNIFKEIDYWMGKYGNNISSVYLADELFGNDRVRVNDFCRRIKEYGLAFSIQIRVDVVDEELIRTLADSGCIGVSYGIESMCQTVLDSMRKGITTEQITNALKLTRKYNLRIIGNLIFGDRVETYEMAKESLDWWYANIHYSIFLGNIRAYPGTVLYKYGIKTGRIKDKLKFYEDGCPTVNLSAMSKTEFAKLQRLITVSSSLLGEPVTNLRIENRDGGLLFYADCPNCDTTNCYDDLVASFPDNYKACKHCGSKINVAQNYEELLESQSYFDDFDYAGKRIVVWGVTQKAQMRLSMVEKLRESIVAVVDTAHQSFESDFMGFTVKSPATLSETEFDTIYIGALTNTTRKKIVNAAKEIVGEEKEIMRMS